MHDVIYLLVLFLVCLPSVEYKTHMARIFACVVYFLLLFLSTQHNGALLLNELET